MSLRRRIFVAATCAVASAAAHLFLGCSPERISETAIVTLRFNPDDSGVGGFQCVTPRGTPVCDALRACQDGTGDIGSCFLAACKNRACDPGLLGCLRSASDGGGASRKAVLTCLQNACSTPALLSAKSMAVVVDFLRLDGFPTCLPSSLRAWCRERRGTGACQPLPNERRCFEISLAAPTASKATDQARELGRAFVTAISDAGLIDEAAPNDQYVIVRVTAVDVDGGCAALTDTTKSLLDPDRRLLGCARSCPVKLDQSADVAVDFEDPTCTHLTDCADLLAEPSTEP